MKVMWNRLAVIALFVVSTLFFGFVSAQQNDEAVRGVVQHLFNEGDFEGVAELYTEDAVLYGADGTVYAGRDVIRASFQNLSGFGFEVTIEISEANVVNDTAYLIGRWTTTNLEADFAMQGYFMGILTREDGEWRIRWELNNLIMVEEEAGGAN